jgi:four helix bundle protein
MTFEEWQSGVPEAIRSDALWKMEAYRLGLFLADLAWHDGVRLLRNRAAQSLGDQLIRAGSRVSACIAEGYSRGTGKERARFYEYGLGSVREARDWYYKARHTLGGPVTTHRIGVTTSLVKLLIRMVANERRRNARLTPTSPAPDA